MGFRAEPAPPTNGLVRRQLRPLLPVGRPVELTDKRQHQKAPSLLPTTDAVSLGRCGIRQCRKVDCNLSSHRRYAAVTQPMKHSRRHSISSNTLRSTQLPSNHGLIDQSVMRVENQISDAFPTLHSNRERSTMLRQLAHHYFAHQIDRLMQINSPHLDRRKYKQTMTDHASTNDVFCVCIIANAKTDMIMRARVRQPDPTSEFVYATTAYVLRQQLSSFKQTDIDWLLVLVIALVGFDLAFDRKASLQGHHTAFKHLIELKGGLHAVGHVLPYVVNNDRFIAIFTGSYPAFTQPAMMPVPNKGDESTGPYGEAFDGGVASETLDAEVIDFCLEQCKLIYLMESSQISLDPHTIYTADASVLRYFLYQRDRLHCQGTCLHAHYHENQNLGSPIDSERSDSTSSSSYGDEITLSRSRCVLLATIIIEYVVAHANYYTIKGPFLASQIQYVLEHQPLTEWVEHTDMLLWILFVLAVAVPDWDNHDWVLTYLRHWLRFESRGLWPQEGWQEARLRNLKRFVWAQTRFQSMYDKVCCLLVAMPGN